ncbi:ROK family transcriptional regulator [Nonomuraea ferruginea]|uniref:ROK family transcriptional regulator n=1 Tax=Nonomuraea ferruginea TaxID=46174 RepID=UPI0036197CF4
MRTATPSTARAINDRLALDLLLEQGPLTAPQLKTLTGLSRPTVSDLIERLQAGGLVEAHGMTGGDRRGPNAKLYRIVAGRAHVAGVGVRRDAIHAVVTDLAGTTVGTRTREAGGDLAEQVAAAVTEAAAGRAVDAVAVGVPGVVDPRTGDMLEASMLPGWRPGLLGDLRARLAAPVVLENEVNLAALAEHREGAAAGRDDFVMLWLDEGIGAAVVLGGRPRQGVGRRGRDRLPRLLGRLDLRPAHQAGGLPAGPRRAGPPGGAGGVPRGRGAGPRPGRAGRRHRARGRRGAGSPGRGRARGGGTRPDRGAGDGGRGRPGGQGGGGDGPDDGPRRDLRRAVSPKPSAESLAG